MSEDLHSSPAAAGLGPHGGTLIATGCGFVEVSVFETGLPPVFRLYFFDQEKKAEAPPAAYLVKVETTRPGDKRQSFTFRAGVGYIESTSAIPEPHEFAARVIISHDGHEHHYQTQHGHADGNHGHAHEKHGLGKQSHVHGVHDHGTGVLGWLRGTFAHSHSVADKVDASMESNERGIWALKISLLGLGATAIFQFFIVLASGSIALLADTIHNFADAGTSLPLWIAFALAKRSATRRLTYGYGKIEDIAGVLIVLIIFLSACVAAYEAVMKIINPYPMEHLWWVAAAAIIGFIGNEAVAVFRIKVGREIGSAALIADGQHARVDGFTSLSVLFSIIGTLLGFPIVDPIVGVGIAIVILFIVKDAASAVWLRLIDGIEPEILAEIKHAPTHIEGVRRVYDVRARWIGHRVHSDIAIEVDPQLSIADADVLCTKVEQVMRAHVRLLGRVFVQSLRRREKNCINSSDRLTRRAAETITKGSVVVDRADCFLLVEKNPVKLKGILAA
jgi:cation diffusion facilitator family transporter